MKILLADKLSPAAEARLVHAGLEVRCDAALDGDSLVRALADFDPEVLVVRSTKVTEPMLDASRSLGLVIRAGAGTNTIAVAAAAARGIYVSNCPGRNSAAVAELAFGLIVACDRQIPNCVRDLRAGVWAKKKYSSASGLAGRTLGLIGLGSIGREMIARARGFAMPVVAFSPHLTDAIAGELGIARAAAALDVARRADVVSLHVPLTTATRNLVDAEFIASMKVGAILINTSRGEVVDSAALEHGVRERKLRVGLDVFAQEPDGGAGQFADPIVAHDLVFGTHHIGASTDQAQEAIADEAVRIVLAYRDRGEVPNCVNLCAVSPATHLLVVRHRDEVGVLAAVFDVLRAGEINVQETQNIIFEGAKAAIARIRIEGEAPATTVSRIRALDRILSVIQVPIR